VETAGPAGDQAVQIAALDELGTPAPSGLLLAWSDGDVVAGSPSALYAIDEKGRQVTPLQAGGVAALAASPDARSLAWVQDGSLWTSRLSRTGVDGQRVQDARAVVDAFLGARARGDAGAAERYLDATGQKAYGSGALLFNGQPHLARWFTVFAQAQPDGSVTALVRLVLANGRDVEVSQVDELLTLRGTPYQVDAVLASALRSVDSGPEVVSVTVTADAVQVTFDSDLDPTAAAAAQLAPVGGGPALTASYADRTLTFALAGVEPGTELQLTVPPAVRDVNGRQAAATMQLDVTVPAAAAEPSPGPSPAPSPAVSPSP
jgi:hypothetical protein